MAKVGAGDSRWIVSNRDDGKNVDNWHWTEKDLFPWCEAEFTKQFKNVDVPAEKALLTIDKVESVQGSMLVCNRKGKTFYVFAIQLKLEWSGKLKDNQESTAKGTIHVDDIANDEDKWKWSIKVENETPQTKAIKDELQNNLGKTLDNVINSVLEEMKGSNSKNYEQPPKAASSTTTKSSETSASSKLISTPIVSSSSSSSSSTVSVKTFSTKLTFEVPPHILYETLMDQNRVAAFTGGPAQVENKQNGKFSLFDGAVQGTQVELNPPKKIVQKWRFKTWPEGHHSTVTISLDNEDGGTLLSLVQKEIPSSDYDRTCSGWENFFWQRIRGLFGWSYKYK